MAARCRRRVWLLLFALLSIVSGAVFAQVGSAGNGSGISRELAASRSTRVGNLHASLRFQLDAVSSEVAGTEDLRFTDAGAGDLLLDFRDGSILSAALNGSPVATALEAGHLRLPGSVLRQGSNQLVLRFTAHSGAAGKAVTRYVDADDRSVYVYTLFVPMDADMAFPCFDQPDLKVRFRLHLDVPPGWTAIGNTSASPAAGADGGHGFDFAETEPISTYLFAFAAGPFARLAPHVPGQPALFVRKSQLDRAESEAQEVQQMTSDGVGWLSTYFAQPFPFPKYDLVLIPGFPFGGMEHAGATFLNEDSVLFRTAPTASDRFRRDILVLHETTHQWFGDLVTMKWFDDLWLKEGFAQYMAYKAMAALRPETQPWKHFYEDIKPQAYGIDETEGTTPIFQNIPNLKDAKSAYGAIVYQKAPAVLKQLDFRLGDTVFRNGLRVYLRQHSYANATWPDLIAAFTAAGGKDVQGWADAWILRRGMPEVSASVRCTGGTLQGVTLHQQDVLQDGYLWPLDNNVALLDEAGKVKTLPVHWSTAQVQLAGIRGLPCPAYLFSNADDEAYGRFLLDPATEARLLAAGDTDRALRQSPLATAQPLLRSMLWGALWEGVRQAQLAPSRYDMVALRALPEERDESLARVQGGRLAGSLHAYLGPESRKLVLPQAEAVTGDAMLHASDAGLRIVAFRSFVTLAESPDALRGLKDLLAGRTQIPGMPLQPLDRWTIVGHLLQQGDSEASALFAAEASRDRTGEGLKYAYAEEAGAPDAGVKARYFEQYLHSTTVQEDWITQSLGPFNAWNQSALTLPYLKSALAALSEIKQRRKIFFLGAWLNAFMSGQNSPEAQNAVRAWLASAGQDPDLRRKVLEVSAGLDRTVRIRARFPQ